jgi:hypothetical protein
LAVAFFKSLYDGVQMNEKDSMRLAAETLAYVQKGGLQINNTINNQQVNANGSSGRTMDSIARDLAEQKKQVRTIEAIATPTLLSEK